MTNSADPPDAAHSTGVITSMGELIGLTPLMLGFRPVNSLVLVAQTTSEESMVVRTNLPRAGTLHGLVVQLRQALVASDVSTVTVLLLGGDATDMQDTVPTTTLLDALTVELHTVGISVEHAASAPTTDTGAPWQCHSACGCRGSIPAVDSSPAAISLIAAGATDSRSREGLAATLAADPDEQLQQRTALLHSRTRSSTTRPLTAEPARGYRIVDTAITAATTHPDLPTLSDDQIVDLALALSDPEVRDRCLVAAIPVAAEDGSDSRRVDAAERLWTVLTRATPGEARAEPAVLLAVHAHLRGDGVLASIALEIAQAANPAHRLARMLDLALRRGMPPAQLHQLLHSAADE